MHHTDLLWGGDGGIGCMRRLRVAAPPPPVRPPAAGDGGSLHRRPGRLMRNTAAQLRSFGRTESNGYCFCTGPQPQGMDISELELVQIIIILLAMTVMVVVLVCLLIHYRLFALSLLGRLGDMRDTRQDASGWSNSVLTQHGNSEAVRQNRTPPVFMQRPPCRFQPTYPYMPQETINLPPIICLPDGDGDKGSFQLRTPEQRLELSRACIRAPPNRTVLRSDIIDNYVHSTAVDVMLEQPPPSYSVTMEHSTLENGDELKRAPKRLQTSWHAGRSTTSTETVLHNSSVT
ncbi:protein TMEPAI-like [Dunckerocampus dactyliophorus]|uniref:protein TMEPAI-like n=1 Tax=Dunckerocampus dactyliophorus TaxID=161453 RepID=UPI002405B18A|nr:protein TMEPAI-like [Dunckerocampus dactyliophorus]